MTPEERIGLLVAAVDVCASSPEFVAEFDRLTGCQLGKRRSGLDRMIDEATGWEREQLRQFVEFVDRFVVGSFVGATT